MNRNHKKSLAAVIRFRRAVSNERQYIMRNHLRDGRLEFPDFHPANFFFYLECQIRSLLSERRMLRTALHYPTTTLEECEKLQKASGVLFGRVIDLTNWVSAHAPSTYMVSPTVRMFANGFVDEHRVYGPSNRPVEADAPGKLSGLQFLTLLDTVRPEQLQPRGGELDVEVIKAVGNINSLPQHHFGYDIHNNDVAKTYPASAEEPVEDIHPMIDIYRASE